MVRSVLPDGIGGTRPAPRRPDGSGPWRELEAQPRLGAHGSAGAMVLAHARIHVATNAAGADVPPPFAYQRLLGCSHV